MSAKGKPGEVCVVTLPLPASSPPPLRLPHCLFVIPTAANEQTSQLDDLAALTDLNEHVLLRELKARYDRDTIYVRDNVQAVLALHQAPLFWVTSVQTMPLASDSCFLFSPFFVFAAAVVE